MIGAVGFGNRISSAERAGVAAKTARRRRWERRQWMGKSAAVFFGLPILFAAVWIRVAVSDALRTHDGLLAEKERLERTLIESSGTKVRLSSWPTIEERAKSLGFRAPRPAEVLWVPVRRRG
jgi:hypothetical protein